MKTKKTNQLYTFTPISFGDLTTKEATEKASVNPFFPLLSPEIYYKPIDDVVLSQRVSNKKEEEEHGHAY